MSKAMSLKKAEKIIKDFSELSAEGNSRICDDGDTWFHFEYLKLSIDETQEMEYENLKMKDDDYEILVHNANHFRLAPPSRRLLRDFGLGKPPTFNSDYPTSPLLISQDEAAAEETLVCTLDWIYAIEGDYSLENIKPRPKPSHIQLLYKWGIIDEHGNTTKALRKESHRLPYLTLNAKKA